MHVMENFSLKNKVALVTGGQSRLGSQVVLALAQAGARVYMASRQLEQLETSAAKLRSEGHDVHALAYDQGSEASIRQLKERLFELEAHIDILDRKSVV